MTWECQSTLIIMLTTIVERGRNKCHKYWPDVGDTLEYGRLAVTCIKEDKTDNFIFREFSIQQESEVRQVTQMAYLSWPDHGVPDSSAEAPELVRYRELLRSGMAELVAQEQCWQEFGREACGEALRRFWRMQDQGNHGWTLPTYLELLARYRLQLESPGATPLPLLALARPGSGEVHQQHWCWPGSPPMRHTCR